ncbi:MAG: bacillithiol biosynthesis BshC [Planctomycetes bacterium]|nr:bacillithiol biosynthesis BshC [Planctomycetota bacterium]
MTVHARAERGPPEAGGSPGGALGEVLAAARRASSLTRPRRELSRVLEGCMGELGAPEASLGAARKLDREGSVAVLAGHQPCVLGGPLFVAYKALGALALARAIEGAGGPPAVAVFWNHSDDHDLGELGGVWVLGERGTPRRLSLDAPAGARPAWSIPCDGRVCALLEGFAAALPPTAWRGPVVERLSRAARGSLADWFARTLLSLPGMDGLVVAEPRHLAALGAPVLGRALREPGLLPSALAEGARRLGGAAPLSPEGACGVYVQSQGRRLRAERVGRPLLELAAGLADDPAAYGADAALRPILQDAVFPTAAVVAGPHEALYLDQLLEAYAAFDVERPCVRRRASAVVLTPTLARRAGAAGLGAAEVLAPSATAGPCAGADLEAFRRAERRVEEELATLEAPLKAVDPTLVEAHRRARERIAYHVRRLGRLAREASLARLAGRLGRWGRLQAWAFPAGRPQERVLGAAELEAVEGPEAVAAALGALDPLESATQVVWLEREEPYADGGR